MIPLNPGGQEGVMALTLGIHVYLVHQYLFHDGSALQVAHALKSLGINAWSRLACSIPMPIAAETVWMFRIAEDSPKNEEYPSAWVDAQVRRPLNIEPKMALLVPYGCA